MRVGNSRHYNGPGILGARVRSTVARQRDPRNWSWRPIRRRDFEAHDQSHECDEGKCYQHCPNWTT